MTPQELARSIGFDLPQQYNAARLLWDNDPDRIAILHDDAVWSYGALQQEAARVGNHLLSIGCAPGDRILLFLNDHPIYPAAIMGAMRAGLIPVLVNTLSSQETVDFYLEDSSATAVIHSAQFGTLFSHSAVKCLNAGKSPWRRASDQLAEHPSTRSDMAFWMYSSGSTGRPKGIVHKHEDAAYTAHTYARHILDIQPDDICFSIPKIFFAYGFGNSITFPFSVGAVSVLLTGRPTPERCFEQIERHRPTILFGLPTLYTALMGDPGISRLDMSSVRLCLSAAEVLSPALAEAWAHQFGVRIVEGLGSTEVLHIYLSNTVAAQKSGSAGQAS